MSVRSSRRPSPQKERYVHYNAVYGKEAERMWKNGEWVDQHGRAEDKITPEQSDVILLPGRAESQNGQEMAGT